MEAPSAPIMKAITDFCRNEQALKLFQQNIKEQRKPLVLKRQNAVKYIKEKLEASTPPCFRVENMYARLKLSNHTVPFNETIIKDAICAVTAHQLGGTGDILEKLKHAIMTNMKNARTTRKYAVEISEALPRELKHLKDQIPLARPNMLKMAQSLIKTREGLHSLQTSSKQFMVSNREKQASTMGPVFEFMTNNHSLSQRINLTNTSTGALEVYYVRRKLTRIKPALTINHMKLLVETALGTVWGTHPTLDDILGKLPSLTNEVLVRLDDGRTEIVKDHITLDKGRKRKHVNK